MSEESAINNNDQQSDSTQQAYNYYDHRTINQQEKVSIRSLLVEEHAKFSFKTMDILKGFALLTYWWPRNIQRKSIWGRIVMNYKLGLEKIDKEMDLANIISKIRQLNYFMKMILDIDHRKLLKLRGKKLIASDEDPKFSIFTAKKCHENSKMIDVYVDNLRQK